MSIPVILPPGWIARLNDLAARRGLSRSALIREALEYSFAGDLEMPVLDSAEANRPKEEVIAAS